MNNPFSSKPTTGQLNAVRLAAASKGVQSSLFNRLRAGYPHNRGQIAWLLIWAGTPSHKRHGEALKCLRAVPSEERAWLRVVIEACAQSKADDADWTGLCGRIERALDDSCHADDDGPAPDALAFLEANRARVEARRDELVASGMTVSSAVAQACREIGEGAS